MLEVIAVPFGYLMRLFYTITHNYALALILFTLFFKLILVPLNIKQHKSSQAQARIRPKERAIRKRYAGRKDQNAQLEMANDLNNLYRQEHVSIFGGCLPMLIQLPIIYVLWQIIEKPLRYLCMVSTTAITDIKNKVFEFFGSGVLNASNTSSAIFDLYTKAGGAADKFKPSQIQMISVLKDNPSVFSEFLNSLGLGEMQLPDFTIFGGRLDLSQNPVFGLNLLILIPVLAALFQFASTFIMQKLGPKPDMSSPEMAQTAKTMTYMNIIFPVMTFIFAFQLPAIIGLYWIYQSIIGTVIQIILTKLYPMPVFTEADYAAAEEEMNRDYVPPKISHSTGRSLHHIDDDDYENSEDIPVNESTETETEVEPSVPPRRRYDKNGNKIRSLHYIDEEDDDSGDNESTESNSVNSVSDTTPENNDTDEKDTES